MNKVSFFEVPADDLKRAQEFYNKTFGWSVSMDMGDALMVSTTEVGPDGMPNTPNAINGDLFKRNDQVKHPTVVIDVDSIDAKVEEIKSNGGELVTGKIEVAEMGWCLYFKDTEGNVIGIWESPKE